MNAAFHTLTKVEMKEKELEGLITRIEEVKAVLEAQAPQGAAPDPFEEEQRDEHPAAADEVDGQHRSRPPAMANRAAEPTR